MINNKGFGKIEVITVIVLLIGIFAFLMYNILGFGTSLNEKISDMKKIAFNFNKVVYSNTDSFANERLVYLDEVNSTGLLNNAKSPFGSNTCNLGESKVESPSSGTRYVTLRCDDYLIDHVNSSDLTDVTVYKVSDWNSEKIEGENVEEKKLYSCLKNGKPLFDYYYEEGYFVYNINKLYSLNLYDISSITSDICKVKSKTFYRTKEEVKENK